MDNNQKPTENTGQVPNIGDAPPIQNQNAPQSPPPSMPSTPNEASDSSKTPPEQNSNNSNMPTPPSDSSGGKSSTLIVGGILLIFVIIVVALYFLILKQPNEPEIQVAPPATQQAEQVIEPTIAPVNDEEREVVDLELEDNIDDNFTTIDEDLNQL